MSTAKYFESPVMELTTPEISGFHMYESGERLVTVVGLGISRAVAESTLGAYLNLLSLLDTHIADTLSC